MLGEARQDGRGLETEEERKSDQVMSSVFEEVFRSFYLSKSSNTTV